jgi:uncharacterized repeat protein (TIGR01451 family)
LAAFPHPSALAHTQSQIFFDASGTDQGGFGPDQIITISGGLTFHGRRDPDKPPGAVDDVFGTAADIYVVPHGFFRHGQAAGLPLEDVNGVPNTILSSSAGSGFFEEVIGTTMPQGGLPAGAYDIVVDEHQNGTFESEHDLYLGADAPAFIVVVPANAPALPGAGIAAMKLKATQQYQSAAALNEAFKTIQNVMEPQQRILEAAVKLGEKSATASDFAINYAQLLAESTVLVYAFLIKFRNDNCAICKQADDFMGLPMKAAEFALENKMKKQIGLAADPPDTGFQQLVTLDPDVPVPATNIDPLNQALASVANAAQQEALLSAALLKALERYQGAQQAEDGYWSLAHAREIQMFAGLLADDLARQQTTLAGFRDTVANYPFHLDEAAAALVDIQTRLRETGLTIAELKDLRGLGMSETEIQALRQDLLLRRLAFSRSDFLATVDRQMNSSADSAPVYRDLAAAMDGVINDLLGQRALDNGQPTARAGGPYSGAVGSAASFSAAASTDPHNFPLGFTWDLDGDGEFNDATVTNATHNYTGPFSGHVGVKAVNSGDQQSLAYAYLQVTDTNRAPVFQNLQPPVGFAKVAPGSSQTFQAAADDPDGDGVTIEWLLDGVTVATGGSFAYQPGTGAVGPHFIVARANDGRSGVATHVWVTGVIRPLSFVDLAVTQSHEPERAQVGKDMVYTITVTSMGPDTSTGVVLTDIFSSGATFVLATASQGTTSQSGTGVIANLGTLTNGGSASVNIVLNAAAAGTFSSAASVSANETELDTSNNQSREETRVDDPAAPVADLSLTQTAAPSSITVSNTLTYTVAVKNTGPNSANGVVLTEILAPGLSFVSANPAPTAQNGNTMTFNLGTLASSPIAVTPVTIVVQPTNAGPAVSVASVSANENDPTPGNNQASLTTLVNPPSPNVANLELTLTASTNTAQAGDSLTYALAVINLGPDTATGVTLIDTLPSGVILLSTAGSQGTAAPAGGLVTADLGTLTNGGSARLTLVVKTLFAGPIINRASVAGSERDSDPANNSASVSATASNSTNGAATVAVVRNFDDAEITQLQSYLAEMGLISQVFDQAGLTFDALKNFKLVIWDDLSYAAGGLTTNDVDVFQGVFNAHIPLYFIGDDLALSATFALEGTPQKTNWVNLIHLNATVNNYGGNRTFSIVNQTHPVVNGPFGLVADSNYGYDPDATTRTGTGEILLGKSGPNDVLVAFKDPGSATKTVTQNILPTIQTDPASVAEKQKLFKNAVTWLLAQDPVADLSLFSIASPDRVTVGNLLTFRLTVKNTGPEQAKNVVLTDTLPAGVTFVSADPAPDSQDGNTLTFEVGDVANTINATVSIGITVKPTVPGTIAHSASVSHSGTDPNPANNETASSATVLPAPLFTADLALSQTVSSNVVSIGDQLIYSLTVTNQGPDTADGVVLVDALPTSVTYLSAIASQGSVGPVESGVVAQLGTLVPGASAQLTITVQPRESGVIANLATVSSDAGDLNSANNSTSLQTLVLVHSGAKGEIVHYQSPGWRYRILVPTEAPPAGFAQPDFDDTSWAAGSAAFGNRGSCPLQTTVVTTWPTLTRLLVRREVPLPCPLSGLHIFVAVDNDIEAVFFNGVQLQTANLHDGCPSQDNFRFDVPAELIQSGRNVVAFQVLDRGGETFFDSRILADAPPTGYEAVTGFSLAQNPNDVWSYGYSVTRGASFNLYQRRDTPASQGIELWSLSGSGPSVIHNLSGVTQHYATITHPPDVLNLDPGFDGRNTVVRWTAPEAGTFHVKGRFQGLDSTTTDVAVLLNSTNALFSADIDGFDQRTPFDLPVTVNAGDYIDFSVGQGRNGSLFDSTGLAATITRVEANTIPVITSDLAVSGTVSASAVGVGSSFSYILTVTNAGPDMTGGVTLTDVLPGGVTLVSAATSQGTISETGGRVTAWLDTLTNGAGATVTLMVKSSAPGTLLNTASVTGNECDANRDNNQIYQSVMVNPASADLAILSSAVPAQTGLGSLFSYSFVITNQGPDTASGVTFSDTLPAGLAVAATALSQGALVRSGNTVVGQLGDLAHGATAQVIIGVQALAPGPWTNRATVSSLVADLQLADNFATQSTTVPDAVATADLSVGVRASSSGVTAGQLVNYQITVANAGPVPATAVTLQNALPAGATFVSASGGAVPQNGVVTIPVSDLPVGAAVSFTVTVRTTTAGTLVNSASAHGSEVDPAPADNSDSATTSVTAAPAPLPDLAVMVSGAPNPVNLGGNLTYTVTVTNRSATTATGVVVSNALPVGVSFVSVDSSQGTTATTEGVVVGQLGSLLGGAFASLNIVAVPTNSDVVIDRASVTSAETDANPVDNLAFTAVTVTNTVGGQANLAVSASASPDPVAVGSELTYSITLTNLGPDLATGMTLTENGGIHILEPLAAGAGTNLVVVVRPATTGMLTNVVSIAAAESDPNLDDNSVQVVTRVVDAQGAVLVVEALTPITLNRQTGLFEQRIRLSNRGAVPVPIASVWVSGLPVGVSLHNAIDVLAGSYSVQTMQGLDAGESVEFLLEFYAANRQPFAAPTLTPTASGVTFPPIPAGVMLIPDPSRQLPDGRFMIEFASIPGQAYAIQYSSDMTNWRDVHPFITTAGTRVRWLDDGPPKTESKPEQLGSRFYRVVLLPQN